MGSKQSPEINFFLVLRGNCILGTRFSSFSIFSNEVHVCLVLFHFQTKIILFKLIRKVFVIMCMQIEDV